MGNDDGSARKGTFEGMSTPFAQAVAGRVISIRTTPLDTPAPLRQYVIKFARFTARQASTEIVIPSGWLRWDEIRIAVHSGGSTRCERTVKELPGATLTKDITYRAWTRLSVTHVGESYASEAAPVVVTIALSAATRE